MKGLNAIEKQEDSIYMGS